MTSNETASFQSQLQRFKDLRPATSFVTETPVTIKTNGLFDHATGRYACVSNWSSTINTLHRCNLNYMPSFTLLGIHKIKGSGMLTFDNYWAWSVDGSKRMHFTPEMVSEDKLIEYRLMAEKAALLDNMYTSLFSYRKSIQKELPFQDLAYHYKEREATFILMGMGIREDDHFPFVEGYAEAVGLSLVDAAKEIVFHSNMMKAKLADSERIRVKYQHLVIKCKELNEIGEIANDFLKEVSVDAAI
jgi:hypothetical protein